jgi:hypothetical protein
MADLRTTTAAIVLCFGAALPAAAADSPACTAARTEVSKTEAEIAALKQKLAALESALAARKADAAKACPAVVVSPAAAVAPTAGTAGVKTARLPLAAVATLLNDALQGTRLRLHTAGAGGGYANDSWVAPGPRLGGARIPIGIPAVNFQAGAFNSTLFLNDINSSGLEVSLAGERFLVVVNFESAGPELLVRGPVPLDVEADGGRALLTLTPGLDASGRPSFSSLEADMNANIRCTSPNQIFAGICNSVEPFAAAFLRNQAAQGLRQTLSTPDFRSRVGAAMRALLDAPAGKTAVEKATGQRIGTIRATRFETGALAIDHD